MFWKQRCGKLRDGRLLWACLPLSHWVSRDAGVCGSGGRHASHICQCHFSARFQAGSRGGRWSWTFKLAQKRSWVGRWSWAAKLSWTSFASSCSSTAVHRLGHCPCDWPSTSVETATAQCTRRWAMARGHRLNTAIVLAAVHGLFRAVSTVEPSLFRSPPPLPPPPHRP